MILQIDVGVGGEGLYSPRLELRKYKGIRYGGQCE